MDRKHKAELLPIDFSFLQISNIDCEFFNITSSNGCHAAIGKLEGIDGSYYLSNYSTSNYKFCYPRRNHWHAWMGGSCPLPIGIIVNIYRRDGTIIRNYSVGSISWHHANKSLDVVAFKVIGLEDGYCWPWDASL